MTLAMLFAAAVLIIVNGFFVAAEFALVACRPANVEARAEKGNRRAKLALAATEDIPGQLAGAQLGITMASLALGFVGESATAAALEPLLVWGAEQMGRTLDGTVLHSISFSIALFAVVSLHMVLGEMVPKNIALAGADRTLLALIVPFRLFNLMLRPLIGSLNALAGLALRLLGIRQPDSLAGERTAEDIATMLHASRQDGLIEDFDFDLLSGALDFRDLQVSDVMVGRDEVDHVSEYATLPELEEAAVASGHSRLVVVRDSLDDVRGFIHVKDVLRASIDDSGHLFTSRLRELASFERDSALQPVFEKMRTKRVHFALVVEDGGRTAGIITLEDVLEQLVGDIIDESDSQEATSNEQPEGIDRTETDAGPDSNGDVKRRNTTKPIRAVRFTRPNTAEPDHGNQARTTGRKPTTHQHSPPPRAPHAPRPSASPPDRRDGPGHSHDVDHTG